MRRIRTAFVIAALGIVACSSAARGQGLYSFGAGAMNTSMPGASTGVGVVALGGMYGNPAAIRGLPGGGVVIGCHIRYPQIHGGWPRSAGPVSPSPPA